MKTEETHFGWLLSCQISLFLLFPDTNTKLRGRSGEQAEKYVVGEESERMVLSF